MLVGKAIPVKRTINLTALLCLGNTCCPSQNWRGFYSRDLVSSDWEETIPIPLLLQTSRDGQKFQWETGLDVGQTGEAKRGSFPLPFFISFSFLKIFPVSSMIMASPFSHRLSTDTPELAASTKDRSTPGNRTPPGQSCMHSKFN